MYLANPHSPLTKYFISFSAVLPLITYACRVRKYPARSVPSQNKSFNLLCLLQHYMSKNGISETAFIIDIRVSMFIFRQFANHACVQRTQINCVQVTGSLRQMDVADKCLWSTIGLGWLPLGSKLHVMLLFFCMCRNHTHSCKALHVCINI